MNDTVRSTASTRGQGDVGTRLLIGLITLTVGLALVGIRHFAVTGLKAAQSWSPTPCIIERSEFERDDEGERYLVIEYRYSVNGNRHHGDRLDMVPGRGGDEGKWEQQMHDAHPVGAEATCYVDPERPDRSVLDRTHGAGTARNLLLMASPFLAISAVFFFSVGWTLSCRRVEQSMASEPHRPLPPPPRQVTWSQRLALLQPPSQTLLAWAFLIGFSIFFKFVEGPSHVRDLVAHDEIAIEGTITDVTPAPAQEFNRQLYEVSFQYEFEGQRREGVSFTLSRSYDVNDQVLVILDPNDPSQAVIKDARQRMVPLWVAFIPGSVMVLLALGIVANYVSRFRYWGLAHDGLVAQAVLTDAGRSDVANPLTRHEFTVDGETYLVNPRSSIGADQQHCSVLYCKGSPQRNVGLSLWDRYVISRDIAFWRAALGLLVPPLACLSAVIFILMS